MEISIKLASMGLFWCFVAGIALGFVIAYFVSKRYFELIKTKDIIQDLNTKNLALRLDQEQIKKLEEQVKDLESKLVQNTELLTIRL